MPDDELLRVLRTLTETASRFEKAAAKHRRIESERIALQEAITGAQLFLSVQRQRPLAGAKESVLADSRAGGWNVRSLQPRTNPPAPGSSGKKKPQRKPRIG
jgi:hypothetical protein